MSAESKLHVCKYIGCNKTFSRPGRLLQHVRSHTGERPYRCKHEGCYNSYARSQHLSRHVLVSHNPREQDGRDNQPRYVCEVESCESSFSNRHNLTKHERSVHGDERNYACPESGCKDVFRKKHQLRTHLFKHQGVLPFQCSVAGCLKKFSQSSHLQRHQKVHQGYSCQEEGCGMSFSKMSELRKHKAVQHRKVLRCETCNQCFHKPSDLANHVLVHSSEREKYKCPSCDRTYFAKRNLKSHIRHYHSGQEFTCVHEDCGISLSTKQKLLRHMKIHQGQQKRKAVKSRSKKKVAGRLVKYITGKGTGIASVSQPTCTVSSIGSTEEMKSLSGSPNCQLDLKGSAAVPTIPHPSPEGSSHSKAMMGLQDTSYRDVTMENSTGVHRKFPENLGKWDSKVSKYQGASFDDMVESLEDYSIESGSSGSVVSKERDLNSDSLEALDDPDKLKMDSSSCEEFCREDSVCTCCSGRHSTGDTNQGKPANCFCSFSSSQGGNTINTKRASSELSSLGHTDLGRRHKSGTYYKGERCSDYDRDIDQPVFTENTDPVISVKATERHWSCETSGKIGNKEQTTLWETEDPLKEGKASSGFSVKEIQIGNSAIVQFVSSQK